MNIEETNKIIRSFQETAPVDVYGLAEKLGLQVFQTSMYSRDVSGSIVRDPKDGSYKIITNSHHPLPRRRFTVAHEIAHFILHKEEIGNGITDDALYRSGLSGRLEVEANNFAANILMPWHLIDEALENSADSIQQIADKLEVSKSAISIRLGVPY